MVEQARRSGRVDISPGIIMVQAPNPTRFTVLLANEQEGWHQTVRQLLEPQGVQMLSARSGREALQMIETKPVHVAVLDTQMPQLGGMQVIRLMREMHKAPPAILLANDLSSHLLREALGMHVFSVLSKPVDFNVLLDTLARVLRRYHESRWPGPGETRH
jgi:CheY-like chemotaxis protein